MSYEITDVFKVVKGSKFLKMEKEIGQIKKGFYADIIAVSEDPIKNIQIMENVDFVMKNGVVYKQK